MGRCAIGRGATLRLGVLAALLLLCIGATRAEEEPGEASEASFALAPAHGVQGEIVQYPRWQSIQLRSHATEFLKKEPAYRHAKPRYGALVMGVGKDTQFTVVVDEGADGERYIYVDRNNDEDLTNDGMGPWTHEDAGVPTRPNVVLDVPYGDATVPYSVLLRRYPDRRPDWVYAYRHSARVGAIESGGHTFRVALLDDDVDGRFDDLAQGALFIDLDGDGTFAGHRDSAEYHRLDQPFALHGRAWEVASVSPDGRSIALRPSDAKVEMRAYLEPGHVGPRIWGTDFCGHKVDLIQDGARPKYLLLAFWSARMPGASALYPVLRRLRARYPEARLRIVGVNLDASGELAFEAARRELPAIPQLFDGRSWSSPHALAYRVRRVPTTFLLDADLTIAARDLGGEAIEKRLLGLLGLGDEEAATAATARPTVSKSAPPLPADLDAYLPKGVSLYFAVSPAGRSGSIVQVDGRGHVLGFVPIPGRGLAIAGRSDGILVATATQVLRVKPDAATEVVVEREVGRAPIAVTSLPDPASAIVVGDNAADEVVVLAERPGEEPHVLLPLTGSKGALQDLNLALAGDGHLLLATDMPHGLFRLPVHGEARAPVRVLPWSCPVAADPSSDAWAALTASCLRLGKGDRVVDRIPYPPGRRPCAHGAAAYAPDGRLLLVLESSAGYEVAFLDPETKAFRVLFPWRGGTPHGLAVAKTWDWKAEPDGEEGLSFELAWRTANSRKYRAQTTMLLPTPPPGAECPGNPKNLRFGQVPFGAVGSLLVAIEVEKTKGLIRVDTDLDGRLTDETPLPFDFKGTSRWTTVDVSVPEYAWASKATVPVQLWQGKNDTYRVLRYRVLAHREGECILEGRARLVRLYDNSGDLQFGGSKDAAYLDLDSTGSLDALVFGKPFRLRDTGYVAKLLGPTGERIAFQRVERPPPYRRVAWTPKRVPVYVPNPFRSGKPLKPLIDAYDQWRGTTNGTYAPYTVRRVLDNAGRVGTDEAFRFLYRVYRTDESFSLKRHAVEAMANPAFVEHASKVAKIARTAKNTYLRIEAIHTLQRMGTPDRHETYTSVLKKTRDDAVFAEAVRYLAYTERPEAQKVLKDLLRKRLKPQRRRVVYECATRYEKTPPSVALIEGAVRAKDPTLRALALDDARKVDPGLAHRLALQCAKGATGKDAFATRVVEILGPWGGVEAVEAMLPLAEGAPDKARARLAALLGAERNADSVEAIVDALEADAIDVRAVAATALARVPGTLVEEALVRRMAKEPAEAVILALFHALQLREAQAAAAAVIAAAKRHPTNGRIQDEALKALGAIGFDDPDAARYLAQQAASSSWADRVAALDAAGESADPATLTVMLKGLRDKAYPVRVAAARALGRIRAWESILPLIEHLEQERDGRARAAVADALYRITGQNLYDVAEVWQKWWNEHGATFEVPVEVPKERKPTRGHTIAQFYGTPVYSDQIVFVIDQSGSMSSVPDAEVGEQENPKNRLDLAVEETLKVVSKLDKYARINVILFESGIHSWKKQLVELTKGRRRELKTYLESKRPTGGTNLYDALERALETKGVEAVYLLSDGMPGVGQYTRTEDIVREVKKILAEHPIEIHGVAIGHQSGLLEQLAKASGGTYVTR